MQPQQILHDRYQLQRLLGDNLNRHTWLAEDLEQKELVVLKCLILGQESHNQWQHLKLFEREAQVLHQLDHAFIPQYRDYFAISGGTIWFALVEEYIPGNSLAELLAQGQKFTEEQVRKIAIAILEILIYLHELNPPVLHRDLKPSNLIWRESIESEDLKIFLVDFGAVQDKASAEGKTITVVGTYGYAPMEQFGGRAVAASDLYALGATLIHLLTGISPADLPQTKMRIDFKDRTSASQNLVQWIEHLTEPDVTSRPQTARKALDSPLTDKKNNSGKLNDQLLPKPYNCRIQSYQTSRGLKIEIPQKELSAKVLIDILRFLSSITGLIFLIFFLLQFNMAILWMFFVPFALTVIYKSFY